MPAQPTNVQEKINWYLSLVVLALFFIVPPLLCSLLYLSQVPDISWERNDGLVYDRIWLHRDRRPAGLGYQNQRVAARYSDTEVCVETRLRFLLWRSSPEAAPATTSRELRLIDNRWQPTGQSCRSVP